MLPALPRLYAHLEEAGTASKHRKILHSDLYPFLFAFRWAGKISPWRRLGHALVLLSLLVWIVV